MLWFCFRVMPQLCPSSALAPVFKQDFGQGATPTSTSAATAGSTNYIFGSPGTDGNYSITPLFQNSGKSDWTKLGDHTGNTNGNMFLVNAGGGKSVFFKQTVSGLCSGSTFNFSAWLANANTSSSLSICGASYVYANVIFNIKDTLGNILATTTTGNLPLSPVNGPANWQQYGIQFSLPNGITSLVLEMVDFYGGAAACGNDLALDDILFTACTPQATITLNTSSTICSGTTTTISSSLINSPFTSPVYQWQKSTDNGVTWTNIGTAGPTVNSYILANASAADGGIYRVLVGPNTASLSSSSCITASNAITLTVTSTPSVSINNIGPFCAGSTLALSTTAVGGTTPYSYSWSGPNSFTSAAAIPSITTVSTAASGAYSLTLTDAKGCQASATTTVMVNDISSVNAMTATRCSGVAFSLTPSNGTNGVVQPGTVYSWSAPAVTGGLSGGASATNAATISGTFTNPTNTTQTATYVVTPVSGACTGSGFTVSVTVNPSVAINTMTTTICSGASFIVTPTNTLNGIVPAGTLYSWSIPSVTGALTGGTIAANASAISGTLYNPTNTTQTATYIVAPVSGICNGAIFTVTITVNPLATINAMTAAVCSGASFALTPINSTNGIVPAGTLYNWAAPSVTGGLIGGAGASNAAFISGTLINTTNTTQTATYLITPQSGTCSGSAFTVTVTVNPLATINAMSSVKCSGTAFSFTPTDIINGSIPAGTLFSWAVPTVTGGVTGGISATNTAFISGTLSNTTTTAQTATYSVTPVSGSCNGTAFTITVTVNPFAVINTMTTTICSGASFTVTPTNTLNGIVPAGALYSWSIPSVTGTLTGGASAANASAISGTLYNPTNTTQTATYIVTPVSGICNGAIFTVTITVNPLATINAMTASVCSGASFALIPTNGTIPAGTLYNWTAPSVTGGITAGISAANATLIAGTLINATNSAQTATYTITPVAGSCNSADFTLTITVSPVAAINAISATICSGASFTVTPTNITNGIIPAGTLYGWAIPGLTGGLTGAITATSAAIISGTLYNTSNTTQTATYTVIPASGSCSGTAFTISITVNPSAVVHTISTTICSGTSFTVTPANMTNGIVPAGTIYSWPTPGVTGGITGGSDATNAISVSGALNNAANTTQTATYTVTPVSGSCSGSVFTIIVSVNPLAVVNALSASICNGNTFSISPTNITNGIVPDGTMYSWAAPTVTGGLTGGISVTNGSLISGTLYNTTNTPQTAVYIVTPLSGICSGTPFTVTVTVNPTAVINAMTAVICTGTSFNLTPANIINGSIPAGTLFSWAVPTVTGGVTGGISATNAAAIAGTLNNATNTSQTATYIVTPVSASCNGTSFTVTVTVNPSAVINPMTATICTGASFALTPTDGASGIVPTGTIYSWAVPTVTGGVTGGISAANTAVIAGSLNNATNTTQTATYLITPASASCNGTTFTLTVLVNPLAAINPMTDAVCSGTTFAITPINTTNGLVPAGTRYTWFAPSVTGGLTSGVSATNAVIISGTLVNTTSSTQTATYTITPIAGTCTGSDFTVTVTIRPVPKAEILITKNVGCAPFTIDSSIIKPVVHTESNSNYQWYVNNVFKATGTYFPSFTLTGDSVNIKLITNSLFNCGTDSVQSVIKVYTTPKPAFNVSDSSGCGPFAVTISNNTPAIASWQYDWDFGNGQYSHQQKPALINYPAAVNGIDTSYTITLRAYQYCDTVSVSHQVVVNRKAKIGFTSTLQNTCSPLIVNFSNQSYGKQVQYRINYGDGIDSNAFNNTQYLHTYHTGSNIVFQAKLYASNSCGTDSVVIPIAVSANPLHTDITLSDTAACGNPFTLFILNKTTAAQKFNWDFGDGITTQTTAVTGNINHIYQQKGVFLISNTISSNCSDTVIYRRLTVYQNVSAATDTIAQNNCIGTPVSFNSLSDKTLSAQWSFGDGSTTDTASAIHYFTQAGTYTAKLTVWKTHAGITCSDSLKQNVAIVARKTGHLTISDTAGKCLPFKVTVINRNIPAISTKWTWGDGTKTSGDTQTHSFTLNGNYPINMEATQAGGCVYADSTVLRIAAPSISLQYKGGAYCQQNSQIDFTPSANYTDSIRWDFGDGIIQTTAPQKISHTYTRPGSFLPKLLAVNTANCSIPISGNDTIQVDQLNAGFKLSAVNECAKTNYQFTDTTQSFFAITRRNWRLSQPVSTNGAITENAKVVSQVYTTAGNYEAGLQIQNSIGCNATIGAKFNVMVYDYPQANINAISQACLFNLMEVKSIVNSQDSLLGRLWNFGNGMTATDSVAKVLYSTAGNYTIKLTVSTVNSCYDSAYKELSIHPLPTLTLASDKTVCKGDSLELKATGAVSYIWKDQNNNVICTNCTGIKVLPKQSAQYKVIGYSEYGCSNIASTNVRIIQPFKLLLKSTDSMCIGDAKRISVNGASSYTWLPTPGLNSYTGATVYASPETTTTYKVVAKDNYECFIDTGSIKIVVGKPTPIHIGGDTTVPSGVPVMLNTGNLPADIRSWKWGGKADFSCVYCATPTANVIMDEYLYCTATNQFGCITSDTVLVKTFCSGSEVFIPNAFTPDGDGVNDMLVVQGRGIKLIKSFRIFSRWGEMVFEKSNFLPGDKSSGWDGRIRGKQAGTDVFVYVCEAVCDRGNSYVFKGNVSIIK